jgi:hypothetical protein
MVSAFRQNFVKVSPDVLLNSECGISATYSMASDLAAPTLPRKKGAASRDGQPAMTVDSHFRQWASLVIKLWQERPER